MRPKFPAEFWPMIAFGYVSLKLVKRGHSLSPPHHQTIDKLKQILKAPDYPTLETQLFELLLEFEEEMK